jgi:RNA recognition motif-containing protein
MSIRLYVGNLPKEVERQELQAVFAPEGDTVTTKIITDRKTGKCRGFGFVTVQTDEQADQIIEKYNGLVFKETSLKIEKALPRTKGKGEKGEKGDDEQPQQPFQPPIPVTSGGGGGGGGESSGEKRKRRRNKDKRRSGPGQTPSLSSGDSGAVQPDPRWASALEELKQRLSAAQTNS